MKMRENLQFTSSQRKSDADGNEMLNFSFSKSLINNVASEKEIFYETFYVYKTYGNSP